MSCLRTRPTRSAADRGSRRDLGAETRRVRRCLLAAATGLVALAGAAPLALHTAVGAAGTCATSSFETGADGWTTWWSGSVDLSTATARSGSASLRLTGWPATARRVVAPTDCAVTPSAAVLQLRTLGDSDRVYLKTVDQQSGAAVVTGPVIVGAAWQAITVALPAGRPVAVSIEAYGAAGGPPADLFVDDVTLLSDAAPANTTDPKTAPTTAPTGSTTGDCGGSFETGTDGWTAWWSGSLTRTTASATSGTSSLQLLGDPATARVSLDPARCGTAWSASLRTLGGSATVFVKLVDERTGTTTVRGPFTISVEWQAVAADVPWTSPTAIALEVYGASVLVDDPRLDDARPDDGSTPPIVTPTTAAPTTAPPAASAACSFAFDSGTDGWAPWWTGSVVRAASARTGSGALRLSGSPATARRTVEPGACAATGGSLWARTDSGTQLVYVKTVEAATGIAVVGAPVAVGPAWQQLPFTFRSTGTADILVEAHGTGTADLLLDDVTLGATPPPPTTGPGGRRCQVWLHGAGGSGGPAHDAGTGEWKVLPQGNGWGAYGRIWDYPLASGYEQAASTVRAEVATAGCGQVVLIGFSNGGAMAAKLVCRGETFGGRLVGVILDDPVLDQASDDCHRSPSIPLTLLTTAWMRDLSASWAACDPGWTCEGTHVPVEHVAARLGTAPVLKAAGHAPETDYDARAAALWR